MIRALHRVWHNLGGGRAVGFWPAEGGGRASLLPKGNRPRVCEVSSEWEKQLWRNWAQRTGKGRPPLSQDGKMWADPVGFSNPLPGSCFPMGSTTPGSLRYKVISLWA